MDRPSDHIVRYLIIFIVAVALLKATGESGFLASKVHKGKGYSVMTPEGWKKLKKKKDVIYPKGVELVTFVPRSTRDDVETPKLFFSILTKKLDAPIWIEDEFPEILKSLNEAGFEVMDKGEIKIDELISSWVVYYDKKIPALILEFYMVTDISVFYKIQYSAHPDQFNVHRPLFEEFKNSFKFRFSLY